jgi:hypothetical protein
MVDPHITILSKDLEKLKVALSSEQHLDILSNYCQIEEGGRDAPSQGGL